MVHLAREKTCISFTMTSIRPTIAPVEEFEGYTFGYVCLSACLYVCLSVCLSGRVTQKLLPHLT